MRKDTGWQSCTTLTLLSILFVVALIASACDWGRNGSASPSSPNDEPCSIGSDVEHVVIDRAPDGRIKGLSYDDHGHTNIWVFGSKGSGETSEYAVSDTGVALGSRTWDAEGSLRMAFDSAFAVVYDASTESSFLRLAEMHEKSEVKGIYMKGNKSVTKDQLEVLKTFPNLEWVNLQRTGILKDEFQKIYPDIELKE